MNKPEIDTKNMVKFDQWYFPAHEKHLQGWMQKVAKRVDGRLTYQYHKYEAALSYCKQRRMACDIGAHVGLMSFWMARDFQHVVSFEPVLLHRECFALNVPNPNVTVHTCALGPEAGRVSLSTQNGSSGDTHVTGDGDIAMRTLDSFGIEELDFLKIDVEGYEIKVLQGAFDTLRRCRPCVMVEQKPHTPGGQKHLMAGDPHPAVDYLRGMGAYLRTAISGDYILSWD
jgi:FkbM family methyltransferase